MDHPFGPFSMSIGFNGDQAIISVKGDLDVLTAPTLDSILGALVAESHRNIVIDLTKTSFIGAATLSTLVKGLRLVRPEHGSLTVWSATPRTPQMLELSGLDDLVVHQQTIVASASVPERTNDFGTHAEIAQYDVTRELADEGEVARAEARRSPVTKLRHWFGEGQLVDGALQVLTTLAHATVAGADGVSVSLKRNGKLATVAATNDTILKMDAHQYATSEGPCVAAAASGNWFYCRSLENEQRWPNFTPLAQREGISSILSTGLVVDGEPIGALNIYSNRQEAFNSDQQELAGLFATQASGILVDGISDDTLAETNARISQALLSRETIAQAIGVLMSRGNVSADDATKTLHRRARAAEETVLHHATGIVASTVRPPK